METRRLARRIADALPQLPPRLQVAARHVLDHPDDVALLSMRELARRAGVPPVTMTRLARQLGFDDYAGFRDLHAKALRRPARPPETADFSARAGLMQRRQRTGGDAALAGQIGEAMARHLASFAAGEGTAALVAAARLVGRARRMYFLGLRSCYAVAFHAAYVYGLFRDNGLLLDGPGDTGIDALRHSGKGDVLLAISVAPYTSAAVERVRYAAQRGVAVVALTDSTASPIAAAATASILVPTDTPSFFHTVTPAFVAAESLIALVAAHGGDRALGAIRDAERQLGAFSAYWSPRRKRAQAS
ncbi:MurR/RpiR family transcriptional regulator [Ferrovibrio sp.]|uniref:MurR/RpiR family transcriptional regulator n=1 Tax=Ferrovibrio sp. TaxID=1917215 RepID=UPI003518CF7D